jgi:alkanesulfonate monooxygenase SsuD/methylene tetrahydromethanopterin reductase-like flavin-dependent oxidoreductase (luciferase family)
MRFGLLYDLRNPPLPASFVPWPRFYAEALDHMQEADRLGFEVISFAEHHGDPDGYNPAIIAAMTAAALRTKRARIGTNIIQLPLHHPVLIAEQLAVVDVISNGRVDVGFGLGAGIEDEFLSLGVNPKQRPSRLEEGLEIVRRCWTEDRPFSYEGKRWQLPDVWINPKPVQKPHPPVFIPAPYSEVALDRVARLGVDVGCNGGFFLGLADKAGWQPWWQSWCAACERHGRNPTDAKTVTWATCFITDDPEKAWAEYREMHFYAANYERRPGVHPYHVLLPSPLPEQPEDLAGWQHVFQTPEDAIAQLRDAYADGGPDEVQLMASRPGMPWEKALEYHRNFAERVLPHVRDLATKNDAAPVDSGG